MPLELALVPLHLKTELRWAMLIAVNIFPVAYILGFEFVNTEFNIWAVWVWSLSPALLIYALDKNLGLLMFCLTIPFCRLCAYFGEMPFRYATEPIEVQRGGSGEWARTTYPASSNVVEQWRYNLEERIVVPGIKQSRSCVD